MPSFSPCLGSLYSRVYTVWSEFDPSLDGRVFEEISPHDSPSHTCPGASLACTNRRVATSELTACPRQLAMRTIQRAQEAEGKPCDSWNLLRPVQRRGRVATRACSNDTLLPKSDHPSAFDLQP